jgi:antitoxin component YwqK of YwqJK toxin-antitoxin module
MSSEPNSEAVPEIPAPVEITDEARQYFRSQQDVIYALVGGAAAALIGALIWALITVSTGYQIGYMAVGVGLLVGFSVRFLGAGIDFYFGIVGAVFALAGCALGNLLSAVAFIADAEGMSYLEAIGLLDLDFAISIYQNAFSFYDILFYGIAAYEGYKFAFRPIKEEEVTAFNDAKHPSVPFAQFRIPAAIVLFVALSLCGYYLMTSSSIKKTFYYDSGAKNYEGMLEHGKLQGEWNYYYENGTLMSKGYFDEGKLDSVWENYDEAGKLSSTTRYKQGIKHGMSAEYFPNGKIKISGAYRLGRQQGEWTTYYENENLKEKGTYNVDLAEGVWERYYENGAIRSRGSYHKNEQVGPWTYWDENSTKVLEANYGDGKSQRIINTWNEAGKPEVVNGNGTYKLYYYNGNLAEYGAVSNGDKTGEWKKYYPDGKLQEEGKYESSQYLLINSWTSDGKLQVKNGEGTFETYYEDGKTSEKGLISKGPSHGKVGKILSHEWCLVGRSELHQWQSHWHSEELF